MPIMESIENTTLKRLKFFQSVQIWPLNEELNYSGWLNNFKTKSDRELACLILDFFMYFPSKLVDQMLIALIEQVGNILSKRNSTWKHDDFIENCIYSYIPGENPNPTDSGHIFTRKLRDVLEIPEELIIDFDKIPKILENRDNLTTVILVDDFVGSGSQCYNAWNELRNKHNNMTLKEIQAKQSHQFIYAPLIVNRKGFEVVNKYCEFLLCTPCHVLEAEYNLFDPSCYCWQGDKNLFNAGTEMILRKSRELGIPFTNGKHTQDARGLYCQGLALKFEHGAPDAVPAFFYWCHENWTPLFKKNYTR